VAEIISLVREVPLSAAKIILPAVKIPFSIMETGLTVMEIPLFLAEKVWLVMEISLFVSLIEGPPSSRPRSFPHPVFDHPLPSDGREISRRIIPRSLENPCDWIGQTVNRKIRNSRQRFLLREKRPG